MFRGALVRSMSDVPNNLLPGGHIVLLTPDYQRGIEARKQGLEIRDTLLVLSPNATSFAFLLRKPCSESTVAENVLRHGVGALWIDPCRVSTNESLNGGAYSGNYREKTTEWQNADRSGGKGSGFRQGLGKYEQPTGRWPSNLVLVHGPGCRREGTRKIKAITGTLNGSWRKGHQYSGGWTGADEQDLGTPVGYGDADGTETVAAWSCIEGCPVAELDEQSVARGMHSAGTARGGGLATTNANSIFWGSKQDESNGSRFGDSGGASRFYPQFEDEARLHEWFCLLMGNDGLHVSV